MIIVTGGAGFIGSNLVKGLNKKGYDDILVVDCLKDGRKVSNLRGCKIKDFMDKEDFIHKIESGFSFGTAIKAIFHQGACSSTVEQDGHYMLKNNYEYSKTLLHYSMRTAVPFIYASSASVYGLGETFKESPENEDALNVYAFSKLLFDQYVRRYMKDAPVQIVGMRYFNVYGPNESHKGRMASVVYHFNQQLLEHGCVKLFAGSGGYADGEQRRDFIHVDDVVKVNLWCLEEPEKSGIVNVGTGQAQTFNDAANAVLDWHGKGKLEYIPFPDDLKGRYQHFTEADLTQLRSVLGYEGSFMSVEEGVKSYLEQLNRCD